MAELTLERVHVYARHTDPMTGEVAQRLVEHNPFLRLSNGVTEAPIYIQHGQTFGEGGDVIPEDALPAWFYHQLDKCTDAALIAVGWKQAEAQWAQAMPQQPIVYTEEKTALLSRLASLSEAELRALVGPEPSTDTGAPSVGTPQTPIADIDSDDFPPDPEEELLPSIPPPTPGPGDWQCPDCGEWVQTRQKGAHVSRHVRQRKKAAANGEPAIQFGSEGIRAR